VEDPIRGEFHGMRPKKFKEIYSEVGEICMQ